jgi:hypothetical protein
LKALELLGVEAQLEHEVGLGVPRELGVPGLVAPLAQRRRPSTRTRKSLTPCHSSSANTA